jgi:DNA-binding FadR family transcriptional regulator
VRTYDAVLSSIEDDLRSGQLKLGDQLPAERSLAEAHGISRASVRDAIRILDVMGIVRTSVGSGPQSGAVVISEPSAGLTSALRLHIATRRLPVADIVQTRIVLETWAAGAAALGEPVPAAPAALARAGSLLDAMDRREVDRETFHTLDAGFHVALIALAGNAVIEAMMDAISGSIRGYVADAMAAFDAWPDVRTVLRRQHHDIFDAVTARDGDLASRLLREHIEWFSAQTDAGAAARDLRA